MVAIKNIEEMPKCCVTYTSENDNYTCCPFYKICKQRETIKTNYKPSDCPLVDIEERKVVKCTDCNEYNQEKHYCPKFCDVIRDTTTEMQKFYKGEHEKLERIEQIMEYIEYMIPTADVIERSEYELIRRQLAQAFDRIAELDKLNDELHSKIDKAIEEIQKERKIYLDMNDVDWLNGCDYVLEILKRNIGE